MAFKNSLIPAGLASSINSQLEKKIPVVCLPLLHLPSTLVKTREASLETETIVLSLMFVSGLLLFSSPALHLQGYTDSHLDENVKPVFIECFFLLEFLELDVLCRTLPKDEDMLFCLYSSL